MDARSDELALARRIRSFARLAAWLFLLRGLAYLALLPPFEGWDEYQHFARIVHEHETQRLPVLGVDRLPESLVPSLVELAHDPGTVRALASRGATSYEQHWRAVDEAASSAPLDSDSDAARAARAGAALAPQSPTEREPARASDPAREHDAALAAPREPLVILWQAQHAPLYYALARPIYAACGGLAHALRAYTCLRVLNLLLGAAAVHVGARMILELGRASRLAHCAALGLALHPLFLQNIARVGNDALAVLLGVGVLAAALRDVRIGLARALALGAWLGLACLVKSTNLVLVPVVPLALAWRRDERVDGRALAREARAAAWRRAALALGAALVLLVPWHAYLYAQYGTPTGMLEAWENRRAGRGLAELWASARELSWPWFWRKQMLLGSLWQSGWSFLPLPNVLRVAYGVLLALAALGLGVWLARALTSRRAGGARGARARAGVGETTLGTWQLGALAALVASLIAALSFNAAVSKLAHGTPLTCSWYAMVALPALLALACEGWRRVPFARGERVACVLALGFALVCVATELWGSYAVIVPHVAQTGSWRLALARQAELDPLLPWWPLGALAQLGGIALLSIGLVRAARARNEARDESRDEHGRP